MKKEKFPDLTGDGKVTQADILKGRGVFQEGGDVDMQMSTLMEPQQEMVSDEEMEEDYLDFILDEALTEEEEDMLQSRLEQDEQLALLFDKVIDVAQEFAGAGLVEGPGNGLSDSIPARLSDGEFVTNAAAVRGIGLMMGADPNDMYEQRMMGAKQLYDQQKMSERDL